MPGPNEDTGYIVGGEQSREFAATGALMLGNQMICTATLIAPDAVLTAAHCVSGQATFELGFRLGVDPWSPIERRDIAEARIHPGYIDFNSDYPPSFDNGKDLALLRLQAPITTVAPVVLHLEPASALLGQTSRLVGFGGDGTVRVPGGFEAVGVGVRRAATVQFTRFTAEGLVYDFADGGMGSCSGDSGGPAFVRVGEQWRQVGVTSWGDTQCVARGYYQRLDIHAQWLRDNATFVESRAQTCDADGECDGQCQIDDDCVTLLCPGGSCPAADGACAADNTCDSFCGNVDPDCADVGTPGTFDPCVEYGLHANGRCDAQCPRDPECSAPTPGGGGTCQPVATSVSGGQCLYLSAAGQVCQQLPIGGLNYDPTGRRCVAVDTAGTACGFAPATPFFNPVTGLCTYTDPFGAVCGVGYAYCAPWGCEC